MENADTKDDGKISKHELKVDLYPRNTDETTKANVKDDGIRENKLVKPANSQIQIIQRNKKVQTLEKMKIIQTNKKMNKI